MELMPNYPIRQGRISVNSVLPDEVSLKQTKRTIFEVHKESQYMVEKLKENFETIYPSIGQLVTLYILMPDFRKDRTTIDKLVLCPTVATCSLITINGKNSTRFGLSNLHAIRPDAIVGSYTSDQYERICHFAKSDIDCGESVWKTFEYMKSIWAREKPLDLNSVTMISDFKSNLLKRFSTSPTFIHRVTPCSNLLKQRIEFIKTQSTKQPVHTTNLISHALLDPEYSLQPIPSIDLMTFEIDDGKFMHDYSEYLYPSKDHDESSKVVVSDESSRTAASLSWNPAKPFKYLNIDLDSMAEPAPEDLVVLIGYQSVRLEPMRQKADLLYRKSYKTNFQDYADSEFMHDNLSVGICRLSSTSDCIITFKGNTTEGSSGSPILDQQLNVIALNFGCYYDYQEDQDVRAKKKAEKAKHTSARSKSVVSKSGKSVSQATPKLSLLDSTIKSGISLSQQSAKLKTIGHDSLYDFDVEIDEPGLEHHKVSLKNRNLAINIRHPVLVAWMHQRYDKIVQIDKINKEKTNFKGLTGAAERKKMYLAGESSKIEQNKSRRVSPQKKSKSRQSPLDIKIIMKGHSKRR